jgi:nitroimidazol reductase NimA-like FMN-containing flavoprotein (pyridoxamine 5'-phosphate oxidase superfamily)
MTSYGLDVLDRDTCDALLGSQRVGRVAVCDEQPVVLPVAFALLDGDVVFRTAPGEKLIAATLHRTVAFEVDAFDVDAGTGWSVDVIGPAEEVVHPRELERARALDIPAWAGEVRDRFIRIRATQVTGRRLREGHARCD